MAVIGNATLNVVPKFPNLSSEVNKALSGVNTAQTGKKWGSDLGGGILSKSALFATFSSIASKAIDGVSSHVGDAVSRFDTLNQYPKTMQMLGYSAESAEASIQKMSDRLASLPTRLDDMVSLVQGIVVTTGNLDQATDAGLALNDMLVASGSSTQLVTAAMEQFRQMLAKGKPEMEDWRSLTSAMPGQMDQLAKSMLGPTANANDLYRALGGGKNEAVLSMDDLLNAMIRLDNEGGEGIASFREQAETAAGGVQTALANMGNAVTKGITSVMDTVGQSSISGALGKVKSVINDVFGDINSIVSAVREPVGDLVNALLDAAPKIVTFATSFGVVKTAGDGISGLISGIAENAKKLTPEMTGLQKANALLGTSFTPLSLGITAASAAVGAIVTAYSDWKEQQDNITAATKGLNDVVSDTAALQGYSGTLSDVGVQSGIAAMSVEELSESMAQSVERQRETTDAAQEQISQLNTAQGIINQCVGQTDLSAEAQGRLEWALSLVNDQLGLSISRQDVVNGQYVDADGNVQNLTDSLNALIEKKKEEARVSAITENLTQAYKDQSDAAATLAQTQREYNDEVQRYIDEYGMSREEAEVAASNYSEIGRELKTATDEYNSATAAVNGYEQQLGSSAEAASDAADAYDALSASVPDFQLFSAQLQTYGTSFDMLKEDLRALGVDTERFSELSSEQLEQLARDYDGTAASIVDDLDSFGVGMDEAAAANARAAASIAESLSGLADSGSVDMEALSSALASAGVTTEQVNAIGTENMGSLAEAVGGDVDAMVWAVQNWNQLPFLSKDGDVTVDDGSLIDAQGNVWVWNGTEFVSKSSSATVRGNLGTSLAQAKEWRSLPYNLGDKVASVTTTANNIVRNFFSSALGNAAGGIRMNAQGGIRAHADGAVIATRAVPLDIVGEDGAEAIVPLTNRRYSQPFADIIADGIARRAASGASETDDLIRTVICVLREIYGAMPEGMDARSFGRAVRKGVAYGY